MTQSSQTEKKHTTVDVEREQMNIVIVGHVDHGKSTLVGRLLADTGALPNGKLEAVKANCAKNAKPFEYAFLLDALKDEQSQGITIDTARCFFKSAKRDYIIIDAPGHIEFLKNMISGAARAEAAVLVIDAKEGIRENSKRHGYMLSFLGIKNISVVVNKMDLVDYDEWTFNTIKKEYTNFLKEIHVTPINFIPISAREGDLIASTSERMAWYSGPSVLQALDEFQKAPSPHEKDFRMPLQDIYKFTQSGDDRRIFAGRIESGTIKVGDDVIFLPSGKTSKVRQVESFNVAPTTTAFAGQSLGFTLETQIYVRPGELMCRQSERLPDVSTRFKANIFWMGKQPLVRNKNYKLKIGIQHVPVVLVEIVSVLDASELSSIQNKPQVDRHDVAECVFETLKPVAFDEVSVNTATGRFVIVDNFEISGGGIILAPVYDDQTRSTALHNHRAYLWEQSRISPERRAQRHKHKAALVVLTGSINSGKIGIAQTIEEELFRNHRFTYFLGMSNAIISGDDTGKDRTLVKFDHIQQIGHLARVMNDAGMILITSISDIDDYELDILRSLNRPNPTIVINIGDPLIDPARITVSIPGNMEPDQSIRTILPYIHQAISPDPEFNI
jgi:bifunctional enzyme CysN/CysC